MSLKYEKDYLKGEISEYLRLSNNPRQGSILWQGYLFGLVAGGMLDFEDYNKLLDILPVTVSVIDTF